MSTAHLVNVLAVDDDEAVARELAAAPLSLSAVSPESPREFAAIALCFGAVVWASFAKGAFFTGDLTILLLGSLLGAALTRSGLARAGRTRQLALPAAAIVVAVLASALLRRQLADAFFPIGSVVSAFALGAIGLSWGSYPSRLVIRRLVVDAACLLGLAAWLGVAAHIRLFARPQAEGWRADAGIGYANVTALVLILGALCACVLAAQSQTLADVIRCWVIVLGIFATQSRGVAVALLVCIGLLWVTMRAAARVLAICAALALAAFTGLAPSIQSTQSNLAVAALAAALAIVVLVTIHRRWSRWRLVTTIAAVAGAGVATTLALLDQRVTDSGSDQGRLRIWDAAIRNLHRTGFIGSGPRQLADFGRGQASLFTHNDALQYAQYYGLFGVAALAVLAWQTLALIRTANASPSTSDGALALAVVTAVAVDALIDFPLQVPAVPAISVLVLATCVRADAGVPRTTGFRQYRNTRPEAPVRA